MKILLTILIIGFVLMVLVLGAFYIATVIDDYKNSLTKADIIKTKEEE